MSFYNTTKPKKVLDFVPDNERDIRRLEMLVSGAMAFPSSAKKAIILHGKYGTGKTELARLLPQLLEENRVEPRLRSEVREMTYRDLATFISCQSNNSSSAIHQAMPTTHSFNYSGLHYVILDEVDNIRSDFQKSMKSFITEHSHVIFIMTTNHIEDVDEGLKR
jgi:Cdc6-like AAA superfamily ATPase